MKNITTILWVIAVIVLSIVSCTFAYNQEQQEAYQWAYNYGITTQPTIEAANLNWNLTRQAFSKMVVNYLENVVWIKQTTSASCNFTDETAITNNLRPYAKKTCTYKIMWSDWTAFNPMNPVSRAQLWTVLSRIIRGNEYNNSWRWYYIYHFNMLKQNWIMNNTNNPSALAKRWDVLIMLKRIYEKFGSNVYMNGWKANSSYVVSKQTNTIEKVDTIKSSDNSSGNYISTAYNNSNVIYTSKDGTKYYYDDKFLSMLKDTAEKKWESSLADYLKIEAEYFKNWLDQLADLEDEDLLKSIWIDVDDIDPDKMTTKEKQELLKNLKSALNKVIDENKTKNNNLLKDLEKITKNIKNDKFWLKEKYDKTKTFMESSNEFLDLYSESILDLIEFVLTKKGDANSEEWVAQAFWLIWIALAYQWAAQEYQKYVEEWGTNTIKLLLSEPDNSNKTSTNTNNSSSSSNSSGKVSSSSDKSWIEEATKDWKWDIFKAEDLVSKKEDKHSAYVKLEKRTLFIDEEYDYILKIWPEFIWYTMEVYYNDINEVAEIYIRSSSNDIRFQVRTKPREDCKYINFSYWNEYIWWANDERVFTRYSRYKNDWVELITNTKSWKTVDELEKQHDCKAQWY